MMPPFIRDERGASAVEFAIVAVPLLLLLFGTIEYGRLMWTRQAMQSLANETARCMGIVQTECASAGSYNAAATRTHLIAGARAFAVELKPANITLSPSTSCHGIAGFSSVRIIYRFTSAVPEFITALATGPELSVTACFPNQA